MNYTLRYLLVVLAVLLSGSAVNATTVRVNGDRGGKIGEYLRYFQQLRGQNVRVVIDGDCLSACTLALAIMPRNRICATENGVFGFHAPWMPDAMGRPVQSPEGTALLWRLYTPSIRRMLGKLTPKMRLVRATRLVPPCRPLHTAVAPGR